MSRRCISIGKLSTRGRSNPRFTDTLPPLDTTLYFGGANYNLLKRKRTGLYRAWSTSDNETSSVAAVENSYGLMLPSDVSGVISAGLRLSRKRSYNATKQKGKTMTAHPTCHHVKRRQCCVDAGEEEVNFGDNVSNRSKDLRSEAAKKLRWLILKSNRDDESNSIKYGKQKGSAEYTSKLIRTKEKWGSSTIQTREKISAFGRTISRSRRGASLISGGYSRESLQRLAFGDLKLYIPSQDGFKDEYTQLVIKQLLVESDTGAKYRTPIS